MGIPQSTMFGSVTSLLPRLLQALPGGTSDVMEAVYQDLSKLGGALLDVAIWT